MSQHVRLFFYLELAGSRMVDPLGVECVTLEAAVADTTAEIRATVAQHLLRGEPLPLMRVSIMDDAGRLLTSISVADALKDVLPSCFVSHGQMLEIRH